MSRFKVIISGGGTGGHVFPAIAIADELKSRDIECEILFVGAEGRMEMEKVPAAGYSIEALPVAGFQRRITIKNITFFFKLFSSMIKAHRILKRFKPDVVVGVGGYASGPIIKAASFKNIPSVIQEQNSFPGVTNRILGRSADKICVGYPNMDRFFQKEKIVYTGNPVRSGLSKEGVGKEAYHFFGFTCDRPVILVLGGSLGARGINEGVSAALDLIAKSNVQVLWQTGKFYIEDIKELVSAREDLSNLIITEFISRMDLAYEIADVVISRAGAGTISELSILGKASVLVPSPNVSEDHQTKNAMALVDSNAALMVTDKEAPERVVKEALKIIKDNRLREKLKSGIKAFAKPLAASDIADTIINLVNKPK
ncbi:undecaprenyldiphospho-muramoylpentapeptide beta-N-acetylglucosaminyltransferase [Marinilabiliaceae bacterium ANBcel2]|nr:undecaprenyldiphospho-muramoylpentapeptide beta-N-acetylglucosaminyltransferase [Marinilabiliaceae bacterium ANBcel2]